MIEGKVTDYGDLIHVERWIVKGRRLHFRWRIGTPVDVSTEDRVNSDPASPCTEKAAVVMDLQADKKVSLSIEWTDEVGNPAAEPPADATVTYTVDNTDIVALTDNGDGTAVAAATGTLGIATLHAEANAPGLPTQTGDLGIAVVSGLAERINIKAGEPEEVTPDEDVAPEGGV